MTLETNNLEYLKEALNAAHIEPMEFYVWLAEMLVQYCEDEERPLNDSMNRFMAMIYDHVYAGKMIADLKEGR